jgi:DNA-binding XRE family transcriptional regulator
MPGMLMSDKMTLTAGSIASFSKFWWSISAAPLRVLMVKKSGAPDLFEAGIASASVMQRRRQHEAAHHVAAHRDEHDDHPCRITIAAAAVAADPEGVITLAQIRAARALLGWNQTDLATVLGVSEIAIKNLERGATDPRVSTVNRIQEAFDRAGVIFLDTGDIRDGGPGLRLKRS